MPLGYSNHYISSANCDLDSGKTGIFGGADCIRVITLTRFLVTLLSVMKQVPLMKSNMLLIWMETLILVGAINISNQVDSFYDVYASGITMNGLQLPASIAGTYREGYLGATVCGLQTAPNANCDEDLIKGGAAILAGIASLEGLTVDGTTALGADGTASSLTNPTQLDPMEQVLMLLKQALL